MVKATYIDENHITCQVPPDLTDIGSNNVTKLMIRVGFEHNIKTMSESSIRLEITDKCPGGYFCEDLFMQICPEGHYCPGGSYKMHARPCP